MKSGPRELAAYHASVVEKGEGTLNAEEQEIIKRGQERLANMGIQTEVETKVTNKQEEEVAVHPAPTSEESGKKARKPRGPNKLKEKPVLDPGVIVIKLEVSAGDIQELLGYAVRTKRTKLAHQLVDAMSKIEA